MVESLSKPISSQLRSELPLTWIGTLLEEWDRALAASRRYEELSVAGGIDLARRERAARQVFREIYAGPGSAPHSAPPA